MATNALERADLDLSTSRRALVLVWQNPETRRFVKVGQVDALPDGHVAFHYLDSAWDDPISCPYWSIPTPTPPISPMSCQHSSLTAFSR